MVLNVEHHYDFRYRLGRKSVDNERQISRWKKIVSRFKGKLVKMIKDADSRFDETKFKSR